MASYYEASQNAGVNPTNLGTMTGKQYYQHAKNTQSFNQPHLADAGMASQTASQNAGPSALAGQGQKLYQQALDRQQGATDQGQQSPFADLMSTIQQGATRQADILRSQSNQRASDLAAQAGFAPGTQSYAALTEQLADQQAGGISDILNTAAGQQVNLGLAEIGRDDDLTSQLLTLAQDNPEMMGSIIQGMGAGEDFSTLVQRLYDPATGEIKSELQQLDLEGLIQKQASGQTLTTGEAAQLQLELAAMQAGGIDISKLPGLEGSPYVQDILSEKTSTELATDPARLATMSGEQLAGIWQNKASREALQADPSIWTGADFYDGSIIDIHNVNNLGSQKQALSERGVAVGKVATLDGNPVYVQDVEQDIWKGDRKIAVTGTDLTTGETKRIYISFT